MTNGEIPRRKKRCFGFCNKVENKNDCYAIYTSPPPTAEPEGELLTGKRDHPGVLLKEKPLERHFNRMNLSAVLKSADKKVPTNY